jgi:hypothetical protein
MLVLVNNFEVFAKTFDSVSEKYDPAVYNHPDFPDHLYQPIQLGLEAIQKLVDDTLLRLQYGGVPQDDSQRASHRLRLKKANSESAHRVTDVSDQESSRRPRPGDALRGKVAVVRDDTVGSTDDEASNSRRESCMSSSNDESDSGEPSGGYAVRDDPKILCKMIIVSSASSSIVLGCIR